MGRQQADADPHVFALFKATRARDKGIGVAIVKIRAIGRSNYCDASNAGEVTDRSRLQQARGLGLGLCLPSVTLGPVHRTLASALTITALSARILSQRVEHAFCCWSGIFTGIGAPQNGRFGQVIECLKFCVAVFHAPTLDEAHLPDKRHLSHTSFPHLRLTFIRRSLLLVEPKATHS